MTNNQSIRSVDESVLLDMHFTKAQRYKSKTGSAKIRSIPTAPILIKFSIIDRYNESMIFAL